MLKIFGLLSGYRLQRKDTYFQYSTSEQFTGEYWIDGKKIYCKTLHTGPLPTGGYELKHNISNFGTFVKANGVIIQGGVNQVNMFPEPCIDATSTYGTSIRDISKTKLTTVLGTGYIGAGRVTESYITLYYTKTID